MMGIFCLSIDTEIYDPENGNNPKKDQVLRNILKLDELLVKYQIHATWAIVADLLCKNKILYKNLPKLLQKKYNKLNSNNYLPELIDILKDKKELYEIASHGLSHYSINKLTKDEAYIEFKLSKEILEKNFNDKIETMIFPRNQIVFLNELYKAGYKIFRGVEFSNKCINKNSNQFFKIVISQILITFNKYVPNLAYVSYEKPLFNIPSSTFYFMRSKIGRKLDKFINKTDSLFQISKNGIDKVIKNGGIYHLYFHPGNFKKESDFEEFENLLKYINNRCMNNELECLNMKEIKLKYEKFI